MMLPPIRSFLELQEELIPQYMLEVDPIDVGTIHDEMSIEDAVLFDDVFLDLMGLNESIMEKSCKSQWREEEDAWEDAPPSYEAVMSVSAQLGRYQWPEQDSKTEPAPRRETFGQMGMLEKMSGMKYILPFQSRSHSRGTSMGGNAPAPTGRRRSLSNSLFPPQPKSPWRKTISIPSLKSPKVEEEDEDEMPLPTIPTKSLRRLRTAHIASQYQRKCSLP